MASTLPPAWAMRAKICSHLRGGLARGKDHLRHAGAQRAVMIELGEAKVLEGQIAQAVQGFVDAGAALAHFVEQRFDAGAIHQSPSFSMPAA